MVRYYKDSNGEWRWQVKARNGKIVADSAEGYTSKSGAVHGALVAGFLLASSAIPLIVKS